MKKGNPLIDSSPQAEMDRFLLLVIHDLRAMLAQGFIRGQLLARSVAGTLSVENESQLQSVLETHRLTNAFLMRLAEYCQAGTDLKRFAPVSVSVLVQNAIRILDAGADVEIAVEGMPAVLVPPALQKVFFELLDNARKFRQGPASIRIGCSRTGSEWIFEIRDNGIGFESSYGEIIWEPLQRLHGGGDYPGFGLGLGICRRIVSALNGRIWAISTPDEGSSFFFAVLVE